MGAGPGAVRQRDALEVWRPSVRGRGSGRKTDDLLVLTAWAVAHNPAAVEWLRR